MYHNNQFIKANDLWFKGVLQDVKKSKTTLQPVFECFTNALEAIKIKQKSNENYQGNILIKIYAVETTAENTKFSSLSIVDNGIGFNDEEFKRFNTFKQTDKGFKNLGSGRIQYVHYFNATNVKSVFEQEGKFFEREFILSKRDDFLKQNAIVKHINCKETDVSQTGTVLSFSGLLENSEIYNQLNEQKLKEDLIERYIRYFCYHKETLPEIKIEFYVQSELKGETTISKNDIPNIDKTQSMKLQYSKKVGKGIEKIDKIEDFIIDAFKISNKVLKNNKLNLVSKGEVIEQSPVSLESLAENDSIKGSKYLFLVSSDYIDSRDTNIRGVLNIYNPQNQMYQFSK